MSVIENFAALPENELEEFAKALVNTINSKGLFSADVKFDFADTWADELSGNLTISTGTVDEIELPRKASWVCDSRDEIEDDPGSEAEYVNSLSEDLAKLFQTMEAEIDGYKVSVEIDDEEYNNSDPAVDVVAEEVERGDAGIGSYEYWGYTGYDSQPYYEVTGTITKAFGATVYFYVEPIDGFNTPAEAETEEA